MPHVKAVTPETGARVDSAGIPMDWYVTIAVGRRSEDLPMLCRTDSKVTVSPSTPSSKLFNLSLPSEPGCLLIILWLGVNMPLESLRDLDLPIGFKKSRQNATELRDFRHLTPWIPTRLKDAIALRRFAFTFSFPQGSFPSRASPLFVYSTRNMQSVVCERIRFCEAG